MFNIYYYSYLAISHADCLDARNSKIEKYAKFSKSTITNNYAMYCSISRSSRQ